MWPRIPALPQVCLGLFQTPPKKQQPQQPVQNRQRSDYIFAFDQDVQTGLELLHLACSESRVVSLPKGHDREGDISIGVEACITARDAVL